MTSRVNQYGQPLCGVCGGAIGYYNDEERIALFEETFLAPPLTRNSNSYTLWMYPFDSIRCECCGAKNRETGWKTVVTALGTFVRLQPSNAGVGLNATDR